MAELTFLMNVDPAGSPNQFYTLAKQYFTDAGSTVIDAPAAGQTLEEVFNKLKELKAEQQTINLVSHASGFAAMHGAVTVADRNAGRQWILADDLQDAIASKKPEPPGGGIITDKTRVVIYGCDVGRSEHFLRLLCALFGAPGEVLGPKRVSVFKVDGATVKYRQAQTWSLVRKSHLIPPGASEPAGGWTDFRKAFVTDAVTRFARIAIQTDLNGEDQLKAILDAAAASATITFGPSFFFEEGLDIFPSGTQTAAEAAASVKPISNGDRTVIPQHASEVDDSTLVTTVTGSDAYPANSAGTKYEITIQILASVIDNDVLIAEGPGYRRVTGSKGIAPSPGPKPSGSSGSGTGSASGPSTSGNNFQSIADELLAAGAGQGDIDAILAMVPEGDATDEIATESPDDTETAGDPDGPVPPRAELA